MHGGMQDAADRNVMGRSTFKNLNLGLATIAAGNASALWSETHAVLHPQVVSCHDVT